MPSAVSIIEWWASEYRKGGLQVFRDKGWVIPKNIEELEDNYPHTKELANIIIHANGGFEE